MFNRGAHTTIGDVCKNFDFPHLNTHLFGPSTVNLQFQEFYMKPLTYTSEFSRMNMDFLCMGVKSNYLTLYRTMDYHTPYPYLHVSPSLDMSFYMHAYCDLLPNFSEFAHG